MYKYADNNKIQVAHYKDGTVTFLLPEEVPEGVVILEPWTDDDEIDYQRQNRAHTERNWRDVEMRKVIQQLDQVRNDAEFGTSSYKGQATAKQLNAYRILLCEYPDRAGFPYCERPTLNEACIGE